MKKLITCLLLSLSFLWLGQTVKAEITDNAQGSYAASPVLSEHQTEGVTGFFDIRWTPNHTEQFSVRITNKSDSEKTYKLEVNKARTNRNGIIDYSDQKPEDTTAQYQLTKMINLPKEVTVAAQSSQEVPGTLVIPSVSFNGILMAGIHISEKETSQAKEAVSNTVAYNLPFVVRGDIDVRPAAKLSLQKLSIEKLTSKQSCLDVYLTNEQATLLKESKFKVSITDKQHKEVTKQDSKLDLTPETAFIYPVKLPDSLKAGTYDVTLKVTHGKDKWEFKKQFTVSAQDAKTIRNRAKTSKTSWLLYSPLVVVVVVIIWIMFRKKQKKD